jgi:cation diffusion facilitator family transporter
VDGGVGPAPRPLSRASAAGSSASVRTVLVAFAANALVAVAKTVAARVTGSASILAEAAHSWADTGNEVFLLVANRRSRRPRDDTHPLGYGREAYVWALLAALGLFVAGAALSVTHGVQELVRPEPATNFVVGYAVLAVSFVLEGVSFLQSVRQAKPAAQLMERDLIEQVMATSDPTLRAVFAEDSAALIGLVIAAAGLAGHQLTGSAVPDAVGSILIGLLLAAVAIYLIDRTARAWSRWSATLTSWVTTPSRTSRFELRALEAKIAASPAVAGAVLSLSAPDEPSLVV